MAEKEQEKKAPAKPAGPEYIYEHVEKGEDPGPCPKDQVEIVLAKDLTVKKGKVRKAVKVRRVGADQAPKDADGKRVLSRYWLNRGWSLK